METITKVFQDKKNHLLNLYNKLIENEFVPIENDNINIDENEIEKFKSQLNSEEFIISVCGAIKSGKSSLLDHIIFNDENVLPIEVTPETAVLTKIKYGNKKKVKIFFYTQKEWEDLKKTNFNDINGESKNYFKEYLNIHVNNSAKKGIYDKEVIFKDRYSKEFNDHSNLKSYISKEGEYTPFVSSVEIETPNEILKDVILVDTPGLNDPNLLRSNITKDWINNSNAIIYLMYSNKTFSKPDLEFIDNNLGLIDSSKIFFIVSKIDSSDDPELVKNYIENKLRDSPELKDRNLPYQGNVSSISTKASVINSKIKNNISLSEFEKELNIEKSELIQKDGYIPEFIEIMDKQLMKDKGESIILTNKNKINEICKLKIDTLEKDIIVLSKKKDAIGMSFKEIETKKSELKNIREEISDLRDHTDSKIKNQSNRVYNNITRNIKEYVIDRSRRDFLDWLYHNETSVDSAINLTGHKIKNILKDNFVIFNEENIAEVGKVEKFKEILDDLLNKIKEITKNIFSSRADKYILPVLDITNLISDLINPIANNLNSEILGKLRERVLWVLWTKKQKTKENIQKEVENILDDFEEKVKKGLTFKIETDIINYFRGITNKVDQLINGYDSSYSDVLKEETDKSTLLKIAEEQISNLEELIKKYQRNHKEIQSELNNI